MKEPLWAVKNMERKVQERNHASLTMQHMHCLRFDMCTIVEKT